MRPALASCLGERHGAMRQMYNCCHRQQIALTLGDGGCRFLACRTAKDCHGRFAKLFGRWGSTDGWTGGPEYKIIAEHTAARKKPARIGRIS
jgi:hypothetical protein